MLSPKKVKWRKVQKGRRKGLATRGNKPAFGEYALQSLENGFITARQIEAARIALTRYVKRTGNVWIRIFPDKPLSKKPAETRMGKGKGPPEVWVSVVRPGTVLYEMGGIDEKEAVEAFRLAAHKLPLKTKMIKSENFL